MLYLGLYVELVVYLGLYIEKVVYIRLLSARMTPFRLSRECKLSVRAKEPLPNCATCRRCALHGPRYSLRSHVVSLDVCVLTLYQSVKILLALCNGIKTPLTLHKNTTDSIYKHTNATESDTTYIGT